ncbi:hypothetical protein C5167_015214 [Papaver somniferum]|uniref:Uncharacterized protein n=1 Tax=Papaver somniferum TaxID=3469 RepID=A0A4Y7J8U9_PAPSO|nr:hypothetical protein C5167_015214 [Papaver somniferum]
MDDEFLYEARSSATTQQREIEARQSGEGSLDSPLLLEQTFPNQPFQSLAQSLQFRISFDRASSYSPFSEHTFGVHKPHGAGFATRASKRIFTSWYALDSLC